MASDSIKENINNILEKYKNDFKFKISSLTLSNENEYEDILMKKFRLTHETKELNKQYFNRELGSIWEQINKEIFKNTSHLYRDNNSDEFGRDKPADFFLGNMAIDTKYRVGSGDSGTLKKFETYGLLLQEKGYKPIFLILREDNLPSAISKMQRGGWEIIKGEECCRNFILQHSSIDLYDVLK